MRTATNTSVKDLTEIVAEGIDAVLPEGAPRPSDGTATCGKCEGSGTYAVSYRDEPVNCFYCNETGTIEAPDLGAIIAGLFTDHGGSLRRRKSYLSPVKVTEMSNRETSRVYTYIRANLEFDLGRNVNLGGLVMNELPPNYPFRAWADTVNAVLLALHGRGQSAGAARWAQALGGH